MSEYTSLLPALEGQASKTANTSSGSRFKSGNGPVIAERW